MKRIQRSLALLLALTMILTAFSVTALAATSYKVATLKRGTWYKLPYESKATTIYKLVLSADSIITVNWKGNKEGEGRLYFSTDSKGNNDIRYCMDESKATGSDVFALSKGTYFIRMYDWMEKPTTYVKVTVQKAVNKANYCRAKAITLKPNVAVKIAQTADYCYPRWYKINLTKKKDVTITTNDERAECVDLYDAKMNRIICAYGSPKIVTEDPIRSGTYFIRISTGYGLREYIGDYITFKWK